MAVGCAKVVAVEKFPEMLGVCSSDWLIFSVNSEPLHRISCLDTSSLAFNY